MENTLHKIKVRDFIKTKDEYNISDKKESFGIRGHVLIRDALTGEVLVDKDNLITLRSRSYLLELLFGVDTPSEYMTDIDGNEFDKKFNLKDRKIALFKIGCGGADLNASPLEAVSPSFDDKDLYSEIPFIIISNKKETLPEYQANPSVLESLDDLDDEQKKTYYLARTNEADDSIRYYGKTFETDNQRFKLNADTGVVYWHGSLRITNKEARGFVLNEIGLLLSNFDEENNEHKNVELFSHICFPTIPLNNLNNGILVDYLVYA